MLEILFLLISMYLFNKKYVFFGLKFFLRELRIGGNIIFLFFKFLRNMEWNMLYGFFLIIFIKGWNIYGCFRDVFLKVENKFLVFRVLY